MSILLYPERVPIPELGIINVFRNKKDGLLYYKKNDSSIIRLVDNGNGNSFPLNDSNIKRVINFTDERVDVIQTDQGLVLLLSVLSIQQSTIYVGGGGGNGSNSQVTTTPDLLFKTINIPSSQVLTLNTSPVEIVPAPTDGTKIVVIASWGSINFNSIPYDTNVDMWLITDTADLPQIDFFGNSGFIVPLGGLLNSSVSRSLTGTIISEGAGIFLADNDNRTQLIANKSLKVFTPVGNPANGDSPISITVAYVLKP